MPSRIELQALRVDAAHAGIHEHTVAPHLLADALAREAPAVRARIPRAAVPLVIAVSARLGLDLSRALRRAGRLDPRVLGELDVAGT